MNVTAKPLRDQHHGLISEFAEILERKGLDQLAARIVDFVGQAHARGTNDGGGRATPGADPATALSPAAYSLEASDSGCQGRPAPRSYSLHFQKDGSIILVDVGPSDTILAVHLLAAQGELAS